MKRACRTDMLLHFLASPTNLLGLGLASLALGARLVGAIDAFWLLIVAGSYGLGVEIGWLLFPRGLNTAEEGVARLSPVARTETERAAIEQSLDRVLAVVKQDHSEAFDPLIERQILQLHGQIKMLIERMEVSTGFISVEDAYSVKRLALDYLPNLIDSFVVIPQDFATREELSDGKTARELLQDNLAVLQREVTKMADDLAASDARSFLNHVSFLQDRFGRNSGFILSVPAGLSQREQVSGP